MQRKLRFINPVKTGYYTTTENHGKRGEMTAAEHRCPRLLPKRRRRQFDSDIRLLKEAGSSRRRSVHRCSLVRAGWREHGGLRPGYESGQVSLYEPFAFIQTEAGLVALVRHFSPGMVAREEKETPSRYQLSWKQRGATPCSRSTDKTCA